MTTQQGFGSATTMVAQASLAHRGASAVYVQTPHGMVYATGDAANAMAGEVGRGIGDGWRIAAWAAGGVALIGAAAWAYNSGGKRGSK